MVPINENILDNKARLQDVTITQVKVCENKEIASKCNLRARQDWPRSPAIQLANVELLNVELPNVELLNVELPNVENYPTSILQNVEYYRT